MLQFMQGSTTITITTSGDIMVASRFIGTTLCRVMTKLDGTVGDMAMKVGRVTMLDDELFLEFHRIQDTIEEE